MVQKPPSDLAERIVVRLPNGMRDRLAEVAKANRRSVNAEVVARLEASFAASSVEADDEDENLPTIEEIVASIRRIIASGRRDKP